MRIIHIIVLISVEQNFVCIMQKNCDNVWFCSQATSTKVTM